jgi:hypothetical protein
MTHHEVLILNFLRANPETFFSRKEISLKAVRRREYEADPRWADVPLAALVVKGLVEVNQSGQFKFNKSKLSV